MTGSNTYTLGYTYNLAGLLATETYPSGRVLTHSYDDAGRLSQLADNSSNTFASSLSYAANGGLLSETWGNSAYHTLAYNNAQQVKEIKLKQSSSGSELQRFDYFYGEVNQSNGSVDLSKNNGQLGRVDDVINGTKQFEQRFSYDELGRLSTAKETYSSGFSTTAWQQQFTFDRYGNRFQSGGSNTGVGFTPVISTDITASTNRFIDTGSTPITYDDAGNITQDMKFRLDPQGRGMNYGYDLNGRQITAERTDSTSGQSSVYDCAGQRVQMSANSVTRQMVYDAFGQLVADYANSSLERENIYRGGQLLAVYEPSSTCYKTIGNFVIDFYVGAFGSGATTTYATDIATWTDTLSRAQLQGTDALVGAAQSMGIAVFTSSAYTSLSTSDIQYVTDLYESYLQRTPDTGGLNFWANSLSTGNTRPGVRQAFAVSTEFVENLNLICPGTTSSTSTSANIKYALTDAQGSTRLLMENNSTSSAILSRHDYLPYGEDIWAGIGSRTTTQKYGVTDQVRQKFALTERDSISGLDHTWFRKYDSFAGRWTSPDPAKQDDPQSLNKYAYALNDPTNVVDPTGLQPEICGYDDEGGPIICEIGTVVINHSERRPSQAERDWFSNSFWNPTIGQGKGGAGGPTAPTIKGATKDQQDRFNDAFQELWKRIHENNGNNDCAKLYGGVGKAEKALKDTHFSFGSADAGAGAVTTGKNVLLDSGHLFMGTGGSERIEVGYSLRDQVGYYIDLGNVEAAAFVLAHELGHRTGSLSGDSAGNDPLNLLTIMNNGTVKKACFGDTPMTSGPLSGG
ncbi:MAG TPA: RHS repeat-associated core domain-containing protein [Pyrinomonadaceae bacterium]